MAIMQRYDNVVQDASGNTITGARVLVTIKATGASAVIYSDEGVTPITNPMITSNDGQFSFYAVDGDYVITATYGGITDTLGDVTLNAAVHAFAEKASDESVNNAGTGVTLQNDDDLLFTIYNGETWYFKFLLWVTCTLNNHFKWKITFPAGAGYYQGIAYDGVATTILQNQRQVSGDTVPLTYTGAPTRSPVILEGAFTATADGTAQLQWAQRVAHVDFTTVEEASFVKAQRVA